MATSITDRLFFPLQVSATSVRAPRRRISPSAGHALEILGHAIEYLADEYVHEGGCFSARDPRVEAIQLLMATNRAIYFGSPPLPCFRDRIQAFFRRARTAS